MEINGIEETKQASASEDVQLRKPGGKPCIYYPEEKCCLPKLTFKICRSCPRAIPHVKKQAIPAVFNHVKALAIMLLGKMGIQASK